MSNGNILLVLSDPDLTKLLEWGALRPAGYEVTITADSEAVDLVLKGFNPDLVILGDQFQNEDGIDLGRKLCERFPGLPVILIMSKPAEQTLLRGMQAGFADCLVLPLHTVDVVEAVERSLEKHRKLTETISQEARRSQRAMQKRLESQEALLRVGRSVTSSLDLDSILTTVVDAAVELTGAEEGSLLLLDEASGELYMRAARNFQNDFVQKFRLPVRDSLAGQVMRTGKPLIINDKTPTKIKTSYLVRTLIYFPLQVHGRVIGVLGVDNRRGSHPLMDDHLGIVAALADYAAIAIENARAYARTELERNKLETILTRVEDGVIVLDTLGKLLIANRNVRSAFGIEGNHLFGKPAREVFHHPDLLDLLDHSGSQANHAEITLEDGRVFNTQVTPITDVGLVVTMQDITHLKELDRIKSDFVHTVSHDLRSPLTSILGYIELLGRIGPLTDQQRDFVQKVQGSVHNITNLINDLLELGRIEAGFDTLKEAVSLDEIIHFSVDEMHPSLVERSQEITLEIQAGLPTILGNPVRLKQMVDHLIKNAIKYTPVQGRIAIQLQHEAGQLIFQVTDDGPGIPPSDQPYIFDKFYRGSNVAYGTSGTGLGLAIVKSIVENHQGRIWVESGVGKGTTFTVVLPITEQSH